MSAFKIETIPTPYERLVELSVAFKEAAQQEDGDCDEDTIAEIVEDLTDQELRDMVQMCHMEFGTALADGALELSDSLAGCVVINGNVGAICKARLILDAVSLEIDEREIERAEVKYQQEVAGENGKATKFVHEI